MRKIIFIAAALCCLAACKNANKNETENDASADVLVTDNCGVVQRVNPDKKVVYLVFTAHFSENDNGAFENFDGIIPVLDTLKDRGVKGSFFPTGVCFRQEKYKDAIRRIIDEGHYLSAHSNMHLHMCDEADTSKLLVGLDSLTKDISAMAAELESFGLEKSQFDYMIPPYECYNKQNADDLHSLGYSLCNPTAGLVTGEDWMPADAPNYHSAAEMVQNIWDFDRKEGLNGAIILVHAMVYPGRDAQDRTYVHLGEIIDGLRERGYDFGNFADVTRQN